MARPGRRTELPPVGRPGREPASEDSGGAGPGQGARLLGVAEARAAAGLPLLRRPGHRGPVPHPGGGVTGHPSGGWARWCRSGRAGRVGRGCGRPCGGCDGSRQRLPAPGSPGLHRPPLVGGAGALGNMAGAAVNALSYFSLRGDAFTVAVVASLLTGALGGRPQWWRRSGGTWAGTAARAVRVTLGWGGREGRRVKPGARANGWRLSRQG